MSPKSSLRSRMLWRVLVPLAMTWLAGTAVMVAVAYVFTRQAFDRSLLDDAYAIAANVNPHDGELSLNLSSRELRGILFDRSEHVFFAVLRQDGSLVAGDDELRRKVADLRTLPEFSNLRHRGEELRMATVRRGEPMSFAVLVAQTTTGRTQLVERLLIVSVAPQALLLVLLGLWLRRSIGRELEPLATLQQGLERRDSTDLAPVDVDAASREVDRLAQTVNSLMARIARGVQAQREFAGNVAHELRTPLAGIRALADYALAQKDPAVWQAQLRSIAASQGRASRLIDQLLALAIADEAHDSLRLEPVMLDEVVRRGVLTFVPRADAAGVDLGAVGLDLPQCVPGSVALLEGLLNNLIDNALRYGRPLDDVAARVTIELRREAGEVVLSVIDNGPGMDAAQRELVLHRWAQGDAGARLGQGAGLGLAIVGRYTMLLGGRFQLAQASEGGGLRASVFLRPAQAK
jgi:two-component system, OmpR family, sensor histidine kinase TctE